MKNAYVLSYNFNTHLTTIAKYTLTTGIPQELNNTWDDHDAARNACFEWGKKNGISLYTAKSTLKGKKRKMRLACKRFDKPTNRAIYDDSNNDQGTTTPNRMLSIMMVLSKVRVKQSIVKSTLSVLDVTLRSFFGL